MTADFYNKVAKKFGGYYTDAHCITEYPGDDPEKIFKDALISVSGTTKTALDAGCADGRFTLSLAPLYKKILAIDISRGMLESARKLQREKKIQNVFFEEQDAERTTFAESTFDVIYSRRGPTPFSEFHRLLTAGGYVVEIEIGETDCQAIKECFARGQNYGMWDISTKNIDTKSLTDAGFEIVFAHDYVYSEYSASHQDLDLFLQGVPIFEDYDTEKDAKLLEAYVSKHSSKKGIELARHRVVIVAKKV